jgi:putative aldouronate transport system substrate-binding protein
VPPVEAVPNRSAQRPSIEMGMPCWLSSGPASCPVPTQTGVAQTALGIRYLVDAPDVIFIPGSPEATHKSYEYQASIIPTSIKDPQTGFVLQHVVAQAGPTRHHHQQRAERHSGRPQPVSAWDDVVKQWKAAGGDKVRAELENALLHA